VALGERLYSFISATYNSQKKFAEILGVDEASVSRWIKNKSKPSREMVEKLYEMGCSSDWLLYGEGDMYAGNDAGMYLAEQHGYQKQKDKTEEMYDMIKETNRLLKEGLIRDFGKKAAANSKYGDKDFQE